MFLKNKSFRNCFFSSNVINIISKEGSSWAVGFLICFLDRYSSSSFLFIYFLATPAPHGILVSQLGMEPVPPALGVRSLNHWTSMEVSIILKIIVNLYHSSVFQEKNIAPWLEKYMVRIFRNKMELYSKLTDTYLKFITSIDTIFLMSFHFLFLWYFLVRPKV